MDRDIETGKLIGTVCGVFSFARLATVIQGSLNLALKYHHYNGTNEVTSV